MHPLIPWFRQPVLHIPVPAVIGEAVASVLGWSKPLTEIPIHAFGVLVALGFMLGARVAMDRAKRIGLDPEKINQVVGWLVAGTFIGGHVGYGLMYAPAEFLAHPALFLRLWDGLSSWGGFLACGPLLYIFFKKENLPVWPYVDCLSIGLGLGWFLGRMGCFSAHDHPGPPTNFYLGVYGICPPGNNKLADIACHDMGLYEALWSLGAFGVMLLLDRKARVPGFYPLFLTLAYTPTRFLMDSLRPADTDAHYYGFTPAQFWCVIVFFGAAAMMRNRLKSGDAPVWAPPGTVVPDAKAKA